MRIAGLSPVLVYNHENNVGAREWDGGMGWGHGMGVWVGVMGWGGWGGYRYRYKSQTRKYFLPRPECSGDELLLT